MALGYRIERNRSRLDESRIVELDISPDEGEIIAHVELAALTANNVTYAVMGGPPFHYWNFFPASDDAWGVVPLWGYATVSESRHPDIAVGARFFGYWPSASLLKLKPGPLKAGGFADMAAHRQGMAPVYNNYRPAGGAPLEVDELTALFQPLYGTGFVLAHTLQADADVGRHIILTSASSKTALATAWNLSEAGHPPIGLTSAKNRELAETTGYYRAVLSYEQLGELDAGAASVLVDFAGNGALMAKLHTHLKALVASHVVGATHWHAAQPPAQLPGPQPQMFFAPTHWEERAKAIGPAAFEAELATSLQAFVATTRNWLALKQLSGADAYLGAFADLMAGSANPREGLIWRP